MLGALGREGLIVLVFLAGDGLRKAGLVEASAGVPRGLGAHRLQRRHVHRNRVIR